MAAALGVDELLGGDPEQPRARGPRVGPEPAATGQRRREGLGRQVGGQLGIARAAREVPQHPLGVAAIEDLERRAVAGGQQILVAAQLGAHAST